MALKWVATEAWKEALAGAAPMVQQAAARVTFETAKEIRDTALENFTAYGIGMETGRSRALLVAQPGPGLFERGDNFKLEAVAGYPEWPSEGDVHSGGEPVPFYPAFLNYGTSRMNARPYFTSAVEAVYPLFPKRINAAIRKAFEAYVRGRTTA